MGRSSGRDCPCCRYQRGLVTLDTGQGIVVAPAPEPAPEPADTPAQDGEQPEDGR